MSTAAERTGDGARRRRSLLVHVRENPCGVLLVAQLAGVLLYPFMQSANEMAHPVARTALGVFGIVVLFIAVRAVHQTPAIDWVAWVLGGPVVVLTVAEAIWPDTSWLVILSSALHAAFYFYLAYALIRYMWGDDYVTSDELFATGAAFTVLAWGFAYIYLIVQAIWPGSFTIFGESGAVGQRTWMDVLFLSITTLTNTGLSDLVPVTPHARSFVAIEELSGVLYLALVVSRLAGLASKRKDKKPATGPVPTSQD